MRHRPLFSDWLERLVKEMETSPKQGHQLEMIDFLGLDRKEKRKKKLDSPFFSLLSVRSIQDAMYVSISIGLYEKKSGGKSMTSIQQSSSFACIFRSLFAWLPVLVCISPAIFFINIEGACVDKSGEQKSISHSPAHFVFSHRRSLFTLLIRPHLRHTPATLYRSQTRRYRWWCSTPSFLTERSTSSWQSGITCSICAFRAFRGFCAPPSRSVLNVVLQFSTGIVWFWIEIGCCM